MIADIISELKGSQLLNEQVSKYTLLTNEEFMTQGALIFVPYKGKETKIIIPAPHHEELFKNDNVPSYQQVLSHKQAIILR